MFSGLTKSRRDHCKFSMDSTLTFQRFNLRLLWYMPTSIMSHLAVRQVTHIFLIIVKVRKLKCCAVATSRGKARCLYLNVGVYSTGGSTLCRTTLRLEVNSRVSTRTTKAMRTRFQIPDYIAQQFQIKHHRNNLTAIRPTHVLHITHTSLLYIVAVPVCITWTLRANLTTYSA